MNKYFFKILMIILYPFIQLIKLVQNNMDFLRSYKLKLIIANIFRIIRIIKRSHSSVEYPGTYFPPSNPSCGQKIAIIDHSYHYKTISSNFFLNILTKIGSVTVFWDSQWNGGKPHSLTKIDNQQFDMLIIWQVMIYYNPNRLKKLHCKNIIIVPMFDDIHADPDRLFMKFEAFRFLCFCNSLHLRLNKLGIISRYFQFFIDPHSLPYKDDSFAELKGFFWQRTNDISWAHIRKLIDGSSFTSFHIHLALDPIWYREVLPEEEEMKKYNIKITHWFNKKSDYLDVLLKANVFFTPRLYEGIGMPVIEAMTMGKVVVAPDHPAMNEYISNGINGLLYDINNLTPLNFSSAKTIAYRARQDSITGYSKWVKLKTELLDFLELQ